jgi:hypothetical protein
MFLTCTAMGAGLTLPAIGMPGRNPDACLPVVPPSDRNSPLFDFASRNDGRLDVKPP